MAVAKKQSTSGISLNTGVRVETRLNFKPRIEDGNLCKAYMISAKVEMVEVPKLKDKGQENTSEYAGLTVPNLVLEWQQVGTTTDPKPRFLKYRWNLPALKKADGTPLDRKLVTDIATSNLTQIVHILQAYVGVPGYVLPDMEINVDPYAPVGERIKQYEDFYTQVVAILTGEDAEQPSYKNVIFWIKLVAKYQEGTYLTFPSFVGQGFMERVVNGIKPALEFRANETIELKAGKTGKKSNSSADGGNGEVSEAEAKKLEDLMARYDN